MVLAIKRGTIRPWATTGNIYGWASLCTLGVSHHVPVFVAMVIAVDFAPSLFPYIPQQYIAFFFIHTANLCRVCATCITTYILF